MVFGTGHCCWVFNTPVNPLSLRREHRAGLFGVATNGDDVIELLARKLNDRFRAMAGDVNPDFLHDGDGFGPDFRRLSAGAKDLENTAAIVAKKPFGHLASR